MAEFHKFMDLPGEIRNMIYKYACEEQDTQQTCFFTEEDSKDWLSKTSDAQPTVIITLPALAHVSRETRSWINGYITFTDMPYRDPPQRSRMQPLGPDKVIIPTSTHRVPTRVFQPDSDVMHIVEHNADAFVNFLKKARDPNIIPHNVSCPQDMVPDLVKRDEQLAHQNPSQDDPQPKQLQKLSSIILVVNDSCKPCTHFNGGCIVRVAQSYMPFNIGFLHVVSLDREARNKGMTSFCKTQNSLKWSIWELEGHFKDSHEASFPVTYLATQHVRDGWRTNWRQVHLTED